jgi:FKBP-type peptidyl-prolyl cis-trans isomerase FklB
MKRVIFPILILCLTINVFGQSKPAAKKPVAGAKKTVAGAKPAPVMKNALDSFSYALGLSMADFYKQQGVENINTNLVIKALNDSKANKPMLDEAAVNNCIISYMQASKGQKGGPYKAEGQAFLDSNKTQTGVVTLPSGLQYRVVKEGSGEKPALTDKVKVHYKGSFINGKVFDSSIERGEPLTIGVNQVIPGWTEALQLMPVGSKWELFIPSDLGYGDGGQGEIQPGSTLLFDVELLEIVK